jgi:hypothetical protein
VKKKIIEIRAHHILCTQGFQGYGYDGQFTENLSWICSKIKSGNIRKVRIINKSDIICKYCPYCKNEVCVKRKNGRRNDISKVDLNIMKILNLKRGEVKSLNLLIKLTNENPEIIKKLKKICSECEWVEKCLWYHKPVSKFSDIT